MKTANRKTKTPAPASAPKAGSNKILYRLIPGIVVFTGLLYASVTHHGFFAIDDAVYVSSNALIRYPSAIILKSFVCQNYHPVTILSLAFDFLMGGDNPSVYHRTNLFLHLVNCILVLLFSNRLLKNVFAASAVALLFGIHPLHVESVAWIAERKDLLYSFFYLLALLLYCNYLQSKKQLLLLWIFFLFGLSLLSKPQAMPLPFILLLLDYFFHRTDYKKLFLEKIPFVALAVVFGIIALQSQQDAINDYLSVTSPWIRILIVCYSVFIYVLKLFVPYQLSVFYPYPGEHDLTVLVYIAPVGLLAGIYLLYKCRSQTLLVFGALFFLVSLTPVLQIKAFGAAILAERYTYIASIGIFLPAVFFMFKIMNQTNRIKVVSAFALYVIALSYLTNIRLGEWADNKTILLQAEKNYPSVFIKQALANLYGQNGNLDSGLVFVNAAMQQQPKLPLLYFTRAHFCGRNTNIGMADVDTAIQLDKNYAVAYMFKGLLYAQSGKEDSAFLFIQKGNSLRKTTDGFLLLAQLHEKNGRQDSAKYYFEKAYQNDPANLTAYQKYHQ